MVLLDQTNIMSPCENAYLACWECLGEQQEGWKRRNQSPDTRVVRETLAMKCLILYDILRSHGSSNSPRSSYRIKCWKPGMVGKHVGKCLNFNNVALPYPIEHCPALNCTELQWTELPWTKLDLNLLRCTELHCTEMRCTGLNCLPCVVGICRMRNYHCADLKRINVVILCKLWWTVILSTMRLNVIV